MSPNAVRKPEQIRLIMECRRSGLSDYQWCQQQGIKPVTFYNWVSKLRKAGYTIPDSENKSFGRPVSQEVVKLDLVESGNACPAMVEQNVSHPTLSSVPYIAAEIECGNIKMRFFNGADASVIRNALQCIGGIPHAW